MAIFMLLLLGGLGALTLKYARISAKHFADSYVKEQAQLFMDSVIEYTILQIEGYERNATNQCLQKLNFTSPNKRYNAKVEILKYYLFQGKDNDGDSPNCPAERIEAIQSRASHGYVLLKVVVETNQSARVATPVRITKRVLQRP